MLRKQPRGSRMLIGSRGDLIPKNGFICPKQPDIYIIRENLIRALFVVVGLKYVS